MFIKKLGMSKGAVYHHFKSKEDILAAVMSKQFDHAHARMRQLIEQTQAANAKDKLSQILERLVTDPELHALDQVLNAQIQNPQFVVAGIKDGVKQDARIIAQIMIEGVQDGSIAIEYPLECAEVFILLVNIWINPTLFERTPDETFRRLKFLQQMMAGLGVDVVSEALIHNILSRHAAYDVE